MRRAGFYKHKFQLKTEPSKKLFLLTKLLKIWKQKSFCDKKIIELPIWNSTPSFANTLLAVVPIFQLFSFFGKLNF
ncbi:hypothetical protein SY27_00940 [Flavobacterium sp. 316]|nr:hypothetical protein SY27_00940 [Flavobacterium sp. 316]